MVNNIPLYLLELVIAGGVACILTFFIWKEETPEQAAAMDDKFIDAWTGHPHLRIIDNRGNFAEKMQHLIREITAFCGCPSMVNNRRKYLIRYPDTEKLMCMRSARKLEITKTYLHAPEDESIWLRKSGSGGHYTYMEITRRWPVSEERIEVERRLTAEEYLRLLQEADSSYKEVTKTRYCFAYRNTYFQIDLYPFWNNRAIAIVEQLKDADRKVEFPDWIDVVSDVTDDPEYKNKKILLKRPAFFMLPANRSSAVRKVLRTSRGAARTLRHS